MTCEDIRAQILVDVRALTAEHHAHFANCRECAAELRRVERLNTALQAAIRRPLPEALLQRVILARRIRRRRLVQRWGVAASVLVVSVAMTKLWISEQNRNFKNWDQAMVEHLIDDPQQELRPDPDAPTNFQRALGELGAKTTADLPPVLRAGLCVMHGQVAAHVVFEAKAQRVVAFLMPRAVPDAELSFDGWSGRLSSAPGGGTVAVFSKDPQVTQAFSRRLAESLDLPPKLL